jgi:hypothetical protein
LKHGRIVSFTTRQGLGDDTVSQILEDDIGHLWLGATAASSGYASVSWTGGRQHYFHPRALARGRHAGRPVASARRLKTTSGTLCFPR